MHELSIAYSLLEQVEAAAKTHNFARVKKILLRIGHHSGVDHEALLFCFPEAGKNSVLEQAEITIEACEGKDLQIVNLEVEDV